MAFEAGASQSSQERHVDALHFLLPKSERCTPLLYAKSRHGKSCGQRPVLVHSRIGESSSVTYSWARCRRGKHARGSVSLVVECSTAWKRCASKKSEAKRHSSWSTFESSSDHDIDDDSRSPLDAFVVRYGGRLLGGARRGLKEDKLSEDSGTVPNEVESGSAQGDVASSRHQDKNGCNTSSSFAAIKERVVRGLTVFDGILEGGHYLPVFYLLKDGLQLDPVNVSLLMGLSASPHILKPALALFTDRFPMHGGRRVPYLIAGGLIIAGSYAAVSTVNSYGSSLLILCANTFGRCLVGVVLHAMVVEVARPQGRSGSSKAVGDFFLLRTTGALAGACASSLLLSHMGARGALRSTALLPLAAVLMAAYYEHIARREEGFTVSAASAANATHESAGGMHTPSFETTATEKFSKLLPLVANPALWGPLVFLFSYSGSPNYDDSLYYFYINKLHFDPTIIGELKMMQELAKLAGIFLYRYGLLHLPDRLYMVTMTWVSFPLYLAPLVLTTGAYNSLGINPQFMALSGELVREVFLHLQIMPVFGRAVRICPPGLEGTVSSLLVSTVMLSRACSKVTSAALSGALGVTASDFSHLSMLVVMCGCFGLLPIAFSGCIPAAEATAEASQCSPDVPHDERDGPLIKRGCLLEHVAATAAVPLVSPVVDTPPRAGPSLVVVAPSHVGPSPVVVTPSPVNGASPRGGPSQEDVAPPREGPACSNANSIQPAG